MIRLGSVSMKVAATWRDNIEAIIGDKLANRIPSELFALRWADVDFDNGRIQ